MRLIGQRCKCGDTLSWLILIGRRFIHTRTDVHSNYFKEDKPSQSINCYSVFRERSLEKDLVTIPEWSHLFPSRTQKLSTPGPKIAMPAIVNRGRCRFARVLARAFLLPFGDPSPICILWMRFSFFALFLLVIDFKPLSGRLTSQWNMNAC